MPGLLNDNREKVPASPAAVFLTTLSLITLSLPATPLAAAPPGEQGKPFLTVFTPDDYDFHAQNWGVAQGDDGVVYVANSEGLLEYDGARWRAVPSGTPSLQARSVAVDVEGVVWVGGGGDFGRVEVGADGRTRFVSLRHLVPRADADFDDVRQVLPTPEGVFFRDRDHLFRVLPGEPPEHALKVWRAEPGTLFRSLAWVDGRLLVARQGAGLEELDGGRLRLVAAAPLAEPRVTAMVALDDVAALVATHRQGLYHFDGHAVVPFETAADAFARRHRATSLTPLAGGLLALGTLHGGVALIDRDGAVLRTADSDVGLPANAVFGTGVEDRQGGLWLPLAQGLARLEASYPLEYYDADHGLDGVYTALLRHRDTLWVATSQGLFRFTPAAAPGEKPRFVPVAGVRDFTWDLLAVGERLLVSSTEGVFFLDEDGRRRGELLFDRGVTTLTASRDGSRVYLGGHREGLHFLDRRPDGLVYGGALGETTSEIRAVIEGPRGDLWLLGVTPQGVEHVERVEPASGRVTVYGPERGLEGGDKVHPFLWRGEVHVALPSGVYLYDPAADRFVHDPELSALDLRASSNRLPLVDGRERLWIDVDRYRTARVETGGEDGLRTSFPLQRARERELVALYADGGVVWAGGADGRLIRYEEGAAPRGNGDAHAAVLLRGVRWLGEDGELLFGGAWPPSWTPPVLPFAQGALRFEYALPSFDARGTNEYRSRLVGLDDGLWGSWSGETYRDFTHLVEGEYRFEVEGRDVDGRVSPAASFTFRVRPPWYRTGWAFVLYALALAGTVAAALRVQQKKLAAERATSLRLRQVDELKDQFLAATSHELKTPLYGIIGLAETLLDEKGSLPQATRTTLETIVASGRRLARLVDAVLDYSQLEREEIRLERGAVDLKTLVDVVLTLVRPLAAGRELELVNAVPEDLPPVDADEGRLEQVFHHLVGNAVKFTDRGRVEVGAKPLGDQVAVAVCDTGVGIAEDRQQQIFEAFAQSDASTGYGGSGLGLAIVQRLVELHGGSVCVESQPGEGSTFVFTLPLAPAGLAAAVPRRTVGQTPLSGAFPEVLAATEDNGTSRILVVDDEPVNRLILARQLAAEDYRLSEAPDGERALALLAAERFDLVLLDVMMPRMSGYEVCRRLRERFTVDELPVIFLTAKNQLTDLVSGFDAGGNDYLSKPISKDELLARVRLHLRLLETHRDLERLVQEKSAELKVLKGLLPICSVCKKIRDDGGAWTQLESYIDAHSEASFSHGLCPDCVGRMREELGLN